MNKTLLSLLSLAAIFTTAQARTLTPQEALQRLRSETPRHMSPALEVNPQPVFTATTSTGEAGVYVFDHPLNGYYVVSASDQTVPLLGYSDSGIWQQDAISPTMRWWLEQYTRQIESLPAGGQYSAPAPVGTAVSPILKTLWNQDAPYNLLCPKVGTTATYTGCVATAMSQVIKSHNWPVQGKGSNSYTWNGQTLTLDFSAITFDWQAMNATYPSGGSLSNASDKAVATLMQAAGYSVNMDYGTQESGAQATDIAPALINHFDYDPSLRLEAREFYTMQQWDRMVYDELSAGRAVIYAGQSRSGGHCFVADGYDGNGYFHINWGWAGMSDGYFLLSALDPEVQGIGGSSSGYNTGQMIVIGIKPDTGGTPSAPVVGTTSPMGAQLQSGYLYFQGIFMNLSTRPLNGSLGYRAVNTSTGASTTVKGQTFSDLPVGAGYYGYPVSVANLPTGNYRIYPTLYTSDGASYPVKTPASQMGYVEYDNTTPTPSVSVPDAGTYTVTDVAMQSPLYTTSQFSVTATAHNSAATDVTIPVQAVLLTSEGDFSSIQAIGTVQTLVIPASGSLDFDYVGTWLHEVSPFDAGSYYLGFVTEGPVSLQGESTYTPLSATIPVTVKQISGTTEINASTWSIAGAPGPLQKDDIKVTATIQCTSGYMAGTLTMAIFPQSGNTSVGMISSPTIYLEEGESKDVEFSGAFDAGTDGSTYFGGLYYGQSPISYNYITFTLGTSTGIATPSAASTSVAVSPDKVITVGTDARLTLVTPSGIQAASASGTSLDASALPSGVYILRVATPSGVKVLKIAL